MANKQQRYIPVGKELVPVSEETYLYYTRWIANERYRARRDHRCGCTDYRKCTGDCGLCKYQIPGDVLYTDATVDTDCDHTLDGDFGFEIADSGALVDDVVTNRLLLTDLLQKLDGLVPNGSEIFTMLAHGYSERQIADQLGIRQSTLNYRKNKLFDYIRDHRDEILG